MILSTKILNELGWIVRLGPNDSSNLTHNESGEVLQVFEDKNKLDVVSFSLGQACEAASVCIVRMMWNGNVEVSSTSGEAEADAEHVATALLA